MDDFLVEERVLQKARIAHQFRMGRFMQDELEYEALLETEFDRVLHRIETFVLQEHLADDVYSQDYATVVPSSTWQMFKSLHYLSWWLGWFVRRWPVKHITTKHTVAVQVGRYVNYPESHIAIPKLGHPFLFEKMRRLEDWEVRKREEDKAAAEAELDEKTAVETYLIVEETLDDLAAATGLSREWFENAMAYDQEFGLVSKVYVIPHEVHDEEDSNG